MHSSNKSLRLSLGLDLLRIIFAENIPKSTCTKRFKEMIETRVFR